MCYESVSAIILPNLSFKAVLILIIFFGVEFDLWIGDYVDYIIGYSKSKKVVARIVEFKHGENRQIKIPAAKYFSMIEINNKNYLVKRSRADKENKVIEIALSTKKIDLFDEHVEYFRAYRTRYEVPYMDFQQNLWHSLWIFIIPLILKIFGLL